MFPLVFNESFRMYENYDFGTLQPCIQVITPVYILTAIII